MELIIFLGGAFLMFFLFRRSKADKTLIPASPDRSSGIRAQHLSGDQGWRKHSEPARWVAPGEWVEIAGIEISDGNFYLGGSLPSRATRRPENCLINPGLVVGSGNDLTGQTMSYWPSYSELHPNARRSYLVWLSSGRDNPDTYIGYVFLYFYGLERRFFIDEAVRDKEKIIEEVSHLLSIYGGNGSFRNYATQFLEFAGLVATTSSTRPAIEARTGYGFDFSVSARLYLGARLAEGGPLDAEDCLLWLTSSPETRLRTPATRCFSLFRMLWKIHFDARHPSGLKVRTPKRRLGNISYRAASGTFSAELTGADNIPDIASLSSPLKGLAAIAEQCTNELESYSRFIGKWPEDADSTEAAVLLPKALLTCSEENPLQALSRRISQASAGRPTGKIALGELCKRIGLEAPTEGKVSASLFTKLGAALDRLDIGYEPDRRYGAVPPPGDGTVVFFRAPDAATVDHERMEFQAARTIVEINALAAQADGVVDPSELAALQQAIGAVPGLTAVERVRLLAYASALLSGPANARMLMKRLAKLDDDGRQRVAQAAVAVVLADGHVSHSEVVFIEKLWKALGLPKDDLYSALHSGAIVADGPVTVMAGTVEPGHAIPVPQSASKPQLEIDQNRLARIISETSAVSSLLSEIFLEEESATAVTRPHSRSGLRPFDGLDTEHGELLLFLLEERQVERSLFEERAKLLRVLPDGAIETINEWGFEIYDEPLVEDEDMLTVAEHLRPFLHEKHREIREAHS